SCVSRLTDCRRGERSASSRNVRAWREYMFWSAYRSRLIALAAVGILAACTDVTEPTGVSKRIGILQLESYSGYVVVSESTPQGNDEVRWDVEPANENVVWPPLVIDVPDVVDAGKPFTITVYTIGPSGCWRADGYELAIGGRKIEIKPYDV